MKEHNSKILPSNLKPGFDAGQPYANLTDALLRLYELSYNTAVPGFFPQYKQKSAKLSTAVSVVSKYLINNVVFELSDGVNRVADDLLSFYLIEGSPTSWNLLTHNRHLKQPTNQRVEKAWEVLEKAFPENGNDAPLHPVLATLHNPPFGYDTNTLVLLFSAWFGLNRHSLRISIDGKLVESTVLATFLETNGSKRFEEYLQGSTVQLHREEHPTTKIQKIIDKCQSISTHPISYKDAQDFIITLDAYISSVDDDIPEKDAATESVQLLRGELKVYSAYDENFKHITKSSDVTDSPQDLVKCLKEIISLKYPVSIIINHNKPEDLRNTVLNKLNISVRELCDHESLYFSENDYHGQKQKLKKAKSALTDHPNLQSNLATAITKLDKSRTKSLNEHEDKHKIELLNSMTRDAQLTTLNDWLLRANKLTLLTSKGNALKNSTIQSLEEEINVMTKYPDSLESKICNASSIGDIQSIIVDIDRKHGRYKNCAIIDTINDYHERAKNVESHFTKMDMLENRVTTINSFEDAVGLKKDLSELKKISSTFLSSRQIGVISSVIDNLEKTIQLKENNAVNTVKEYRTKVDKSNNVSDLSEYFSEINRGIPFLKKEYDPQVDEIIKTIKTKIDLDTVGQITHLFANIMEYDEKERLLETLNNMLSDSNDIESNNA